jgi:CheY-like chemotaxis protein
LDACLPDGDGRDICSQIKLSTHTRHIPVIICSGLDDLEECLKQAGPPDGVLQKPFDMHSFVQMVGEKLPLAA